MSKKGITFSELKGEFAKVVESSSFVQILFLINNRIAEIDQYMDRVEQEGSEYGRGFHDGYSEALKNELNVLHALLVFIWPKV